MFERIFNKIYFITKIYPFAYAAAFILDRLQRCALMIRILLVDKKNRVIFSESESLLILQQLRPYDLMRPEETDIVRHEEDPDINLSIIIPMYNAGKYIDDCMNSVLTQKTNFCYEVIVVNDGSTDDTPEKLKRYSMNPNVIVLNQENLGLSKSRNRAMALARGRYFMFVDSDDQLLENAIEIMIKEAYSSQADIVDGNYLLCKEGKKWTGRPLYRKLRQINLQKDPEVILTIHGYPWGKTYARELWDDLLFPADLIYEDTINRMVLFRRARTYVYLPDPVYIYRLHGESITNRTDSTPKCIDTYYIIDRLLAENSRLNLPYNEILYRIVLKQLGSIFYRRTNRLDLSTREALLVMAGQIMKEINAYQPQKLTTHERYLTQAIESLNLPMWEICCQHDE